MIQREALPTAPSSMDSNPSSTAQTPEPFSQHSTDVVTQSQIIGGQSIHLNPTKIKN